MDTTRRAVVFDVGSSSTRVGLSSDQTPTIFPTLVTKSDGQVRVGGPGETIRVQDMMIANFDHVTKIWEHGYELLKVDPKEHPVFLNKPSYPSPTAQTEKMAQIMFEEFGVPALHLNYPAVMALHGHGSDCGLVVDSGFSETQFYPVYQGHILKWPVTRGLQVAGDYLTSLLLDVLQKKGACTYTTAEQIKEKSFYVSGDPENEKPTPETCVLEDANVTLLEEKFKIPEELYTSRLEYCGIHEYVLKTLYKCDPELRPTLFKNIVLTGGNSQMPGFAPRLEKELIKSLPYYKTLHNERPRITVSAPNVAWIGGTKLASLPTFLDTCMTMADYDEYGPTLVNTKFF